MKKTILTLLFLGTFSFCFSQSSKLMVYVQFTGIEAGYDHETKTSVFVDGKEYGTSSVTLQSKTGSFAVEVPQGNHSLRVVNYALYEGNWEEHTIENDYSIDCVFESETKFSKKPQKLYLVFDIDSRTHYSWKKPVKK